MPFFKTTANIFKDGGEHFDENWMNYDTVQTPPKTNWDYSREMQIEDVDIWEVIYEQGGGVGVYVAWSPYAEFYLIRTGHWNVPNDIETYYGPEAGKKVYKWMIDFGLKPVVNKVWVEDEDLWIYSSQEKKNLFFI